MNHLFNLKHYKEILNSALQSDYTFCKFSDLSTDRRKIYLRHDVDNCVDSAYIMAKVEQELRVHSTYLFFLRSKNYNILSEDTLEKIKQIHLMGHDIGLHAILENNKRLGTTIKNDLSLMKRILDINVKVFSIHNPTEQEFQVDVPGMINVYGKAYFEDIKYISESNMQWREGCPCEILKNKKYQELQILIHPMTYRYDFKNDRDILKYFLYSKIIELKELNERENKNLIEEKISINELTDYFLNG